MKLTQLPILAGLVIAAVVAGPLIVPAQAGQRKDPNQDKPATNLPNYSNPFRGTVENVTANNVVVTGDKGPSGTFVIQAGTKILRDGKPIMAAQVFKGDAIQVSFTVVKTTGLLLASEIIVGTLPAPTPETPADTGGKKKKKKQ